MNISLSAAIANKRDYNGSIKRQMTVVKYWVHRLLQS